MLVSRLALHVLVIGADCYQTSDQTFGLYCDREYYVFVTKDIFEDKHNWATTRFCKKQWNDGGWMPSRQINDRVTEREKRLENRL